MTIDAQISRLDQSVEGLAAAVASLDEELFLEKLNGWSSRDIVAHLIGWNRFVIQGSKQITRGELPSYDVDPGENYSKVNAKLIREYPSTDQRELLEELRSSARELTQCRAPRPPFFQSALTCSVNSGSIMTRISDTA